MASDEKDPVGCVVGLLQDDLARQGYLDQQDVLRAVTRHDLSSDQEVLVRRQLTELDVELQDEYGLLREEEAGESTARTDRSRPVPPERAWMSRVLGKARLIKQEEVVALGRQIQRGIRATEQVTVDGASPALSQIVNEGIDAKRKLVAANLRLVATIAREYQGLSDLELVDLIQEGCLGLIRAAEKFDPNLGYRFSTYGPAPENRSAIRTVSLARCVESGHVRRVSRSWSNAAAI
jgi:DNA-directed RNA polymerase sigma subunit (sigma70/sigma32)